MYRNPWISNYLTHVKFCSQGLGSETSIKLSNPRLLQKRALSFQKEFSFDEKDNPAKSTKDIDVSVLANLPKVSELRKRFESVTTSTSDWEMNRKERIARRLEGIEGEVHPSLLPSLVANRLLEEDTPRYTRASDPCEPCGVTGQRYAMEGFESPEMQLMAPEHQSRPRCRPDPQSFIHTEPMFSSGSTTSAPELESKAERIARYKAERRRQLAERYGISLDQEPDVECPSRYSHPQKESEGSERRNRSESAGEKDRDITLSSHTSTSAISPRVGCTAPQQGHSEMGRRRLDSFSERERLMNLENQRRAAHPEPPSSSYMDVTSLSSAAWVPAKDYSVTGMPPSPPKLSRDSSVSSAKQGVSPGDHFIEQQAHNILSRQGIRVRERLVREEGHQKSPELGKVRETPGYCRQFQYRNQNSTQYHAETPGPHQTYSHPHHQPQPQLTQPGPLGVQEVGGYPSYLSMASGPSSRAGEQQPEEETERTEDAKTRGLLRSRQAVLPSEIRRRERSTEDPRRGWREEELGVSKALSLSQAREAEDPAREGHRGRARLDETEHIYHLQASEIRPRELDNAMYIHKGLVATYIQPRAALAGPGISTSITAPSHLVSDTGDPQAPIQRNRQHQTHDHREVREGGGFGNKENQLDNRMSVAQLRHSYMESTTTPPTSRRNELSSVSSDLASAEADEERLDERAKLSVAAKRSLFRELEKNIDGGGPKVRSRNAAVDRRLRRTQDRSRTQPVTTEEVVIAATLQASSQQSTATREQVWAARQVKDTLEVQSTMPVSTMEGKQQSHNQSQSQGQGQEEPDLCTLSLAEKMALFNRLAQTPTRVTRTRGDTRQRRANARYQTQPITLGDMEQLQNGTGSQFRHLPASSSSSDLRAGGTVSTDHAGDIHLTRGEPRDELLPTSTSDTSLPPRQPEGPTWRSQDHQKYRVFPQEEDRADLCGGKRKLPSPEGVVRQANLPQPHTGKERRAEEEQQQEEEEEEEEEEQWWVTRQGAAVQSSESHMLQEWQREEVYRREEGHYPDSQKSRAISGELLESTVVTSRAASRLPRTACQPPAADAHVNDSRPTAGLVQPEQGDELNDMMTARHMSIRDRVALLKKSGEQDWRNRINKKQDVGEQHTQLQEVEESFKTKGDEALVMIDEFAVSDQLWRISESEMECYSIEALMSIQERKQLIVAQEEAWKTKGHGAANDSTQFTVAARMVKKGLASPTALQSTSSSKPKNNSLAISKPQEEIKAVPDLNLESDLKLDKLESFLGKLNSKVSGLPEATITVTQKKVKEVMTLEDETFSKFYRQVEELPIATNKMEIDNDFDAIFGPQTPKLTSEMVQHKRAVRPARNVQASRNPLKMLAAREDIRHEYTEQRLNIGLLESKRMKAEKSE